MARGWAGGGLLAVGLLCMSVKVARSSSLAAYPPLNPGGCVLRFSELRMRGGGEGGHKGRRRRKSSKNQTQAHSNVLENFQTIRPKNVLTDLQREGDAAPPPTDGDWHQTAGEEAQEPKTDRGCTSDIAEGKHQHESAAGQSKVKELPKQGNNTRLPAQGTRRTRAQETQPREETMKSTTKRDEGLEEVVAVGQEHPKSHELDERHSAQAVKTRSKEQEEKERERIEAQPECARKIAQEEQKNHHVAQETKRTQEQRKRRERREEREEQKGQEQEIDRGFPEDEMTEAGLTGRYPHKEQARERARGRQELDRMPGQREQRHQVEEQYEMIIQERCDDRGVSEHRVAHERQESHEEEDEMGRVSRELDRMPGQQKRRHRQVEQELERARGSLERLRTRGLQEVLELQGKREEQEEQEYARPQERRDSHGVPESRRVQDRHERQEAVSMAAGRRTGDQLVVEKELPSDSLRGSDGEDEDTDMDFFDFDYLPKSVIAKRRENEEQEKLKMFGGGLGDIVNKPTTPRWKRFDDDEVILQEDMGKGMTWSQRRKLEEAQRIEREFGGGLDSLVHRNEEKKTADVEPVGTCQSPTWKERRRQEEENRIKSFGGGLDSLVKHESSFEKQKRLARERANRRSERAKKAEEP
eukprot:532754-Hanusia_phi.AAC.1